jgi:hypothetical protein
MYLATLTAPEPRTTIDGLAHFIRITFAKLGIIIHKFHTPSYQQLESVRLVHLKFDFILETNDPTCDQHRVDFRLSNDLESRTRHAERILERLHEFASAEKEYFAKDKETRGPLTAKPLEIVHTPASSRGKEKFWKVKLLTRTVVRPLFR